MKSYQWGRQTIRRLALVLLLVASVVATITFYLAPDSWQAMSGWRFGRLFWFVEGIAFLGGSLIWAGNELNGFFHT
jgi:hypothetical protein